MRDPSQATYLSGSSRIGASASLFLVDLRKILCLQCLFKSIRISVFGDEARDALHKILLHFLFGNARHWRVGDGGYEYHLEKKLFNCRLPCTVRWQRADGGSIRLSLSGKFLIIFERMTPVINSRRGKTKHLYSS